MICGIFGGSTDPIFSSILPFHIGYIVLFGIFWTLGSISNGVLVLVIHIGGECFRVDFVFWIVDTCFHFIHERKKRMGELRVYIRGFNHDIWFDVRIWAMF